MHSLVNPFGTGFPQTRSGPPGLHVGVICEPASLSTVSSETDADPQKAVTPGESTPVPKGLTGLFLFARILRIFWDLDARFSEKEVDVVSLS